MSEDSAEFKRGHAKGRSEGYAEALDLIQLRRWAIELASSHHRAHGCAEDITHHAAMLMAYVEGKPK